MKTKYTWFNSDRSGLELQIESDYADVYCEYNLRSVLPFHKQIWSQNGANSEEKGGNLHV